MMQTKTLDASLESDGIKVDAVISTESIDRDGEVLIAQGMDSSEYDDNPVVFYNHDYAQPIGQVTNLRRGKDKVEATIKFAKRPDDFQGSYFPEFVESLVQQGIVKGISVGFVPKPGGVRKASAKDRESYGDDVQQVYSQWKLLEVSVAPLPANGRALVSAVRKGLVDQAEAKKWIGCEASSAKHVIEVQVPKRGLMDKF